MPHIVNSELWNESNVETNDSTPQLSQLRSVQDVGWAISIKFGFVL